MLIRIIKMFNKINHQFRISTVQLITSKYQILKFLTHILILFRNSPSQITNKFIMMKIQTKKIKN